MKEEIFIYLNNLDRTDKLLIRDQYYLFCGGNKSKQEKAISKIIETIKNKLKGVIKIMWWLISIPIINFLAIGLISYQSGKELKEDIAEKRL